MARARDPFADPQPLIRRVYAYVGYRIGHTQDAEDVTSTVLERALRYRSSYDPSKGEPLGWLLGIARHCVDDFLRTRPPFAPEQPDRGGAEFEAATVDRLSVAAALATLDHRDRELIALRYGADLSSREIGGLLEMRPNSVDVALHRCRERLRAELADPAPTVPRGHVRVGRPASETHP